MFPNRVANPGESTNWPEAQRSLRLSSFSFTRCTMISKLTRLMLALAMATTLSLAMGCEKEEAAPPPPTPPADTTPTDGTTPPPPAPDAK